MFLFEGRFPENRTTYIIETAKRQHQHPTILGETYNDRYFSRTYGIYELQYRMNNDQATILLFGEIKIWPLGTEFFEGLLKNAGE